MRAEDDEPRLVGVLADPYTGEILQRHEGPRFALQTSGFLWIEVDEETPADICATHMVEDPTAEEPVIVEKPLIEPVLEPQGPGVVKVSGLPQECRVWWAEEEPVDVSGGEVVLEGAPGLPTRLIIAATRWRTYRGEVNP